MKTIHRFFVEPHHIKGDKVILESDIHHMKKVLRLKQNDLIGIFDGKGTEYRAKIESVGTKTLCIIQEKIEFHAPAVSVSLAVAIVKPKAMTDIIRKCTELGVSAFMPMITEHTVIRATQENRWLRIAKEASKQCERTTLPVIEAKQQFDVILSKSSQYDLTIMLTERADSSNLVEMLRKHKNAKKFLILVGPEGGFTADEMNSAKEANVQFAGLGSTILQSSTAAIVSAGIAICERT